MQDQGQTVTFNPPEPFPEKMAGRGESRRGCHQFQQDIVGNDMIVNNTKVGRGSIIQGRPLRELPRLTGKRRNINREPVRYWTEEEHRLFLVGVQRYGGRNYKALSEHIKTRTPTQVRTHLQKYLLKLQVRFVFLTAVLFLVITPQNR